MWRLMSVESLFIETRSVNSSWKDTRTSEFQLLGSENPKKRAYTVLSDYSVSRLGVANQPEMKILKVSDEYTCCVNNTGRIC
mmetsp:Transcript_13317/g.18615  ORF Transcript_13317/g.18615 Transcript_13317/m.18615 type:complete len:82 (-) Transcript_13317:1028-1273(-)